MALLQIAEPGESTAPHEHRLAVGIDLGTTNSLVATVKSGTAEVLLNQEGNKLTPSVVRYFADGGVTVGRQPKAEQADDPANIIVSVKRFMGRGMADVARYGALPYKFIDAPGMVKIETVAGLKSPVDVSADILRVLRLQAEAALAGPLVGAVITVPAYFDDAQRQATKDAARLAGLNVLRLLNEPTAAAIAYGLDNASEGTFAVFDLGGGTFDITILEIDDGLFEVKSTNGDTFLGGEDFDMRIVNFLADEFKKEHGVDLSLDKMALQRLKEAAEKAKIELSSSSQTEINQPFISMDRNTGQPLHLVVKLTRAKLESLVDDLIKKSIKPCQAALKDAGISMSDIDEVVLVGGMTRMPRVIEEVTKFFGKEPHKGVNPDEVVAAGAAIQAGVLQGDVKDVVLLDVTPLSLGIETLGGVFTRLIDRNTTIPTKKSQVFSTAEDNQNAVTIRCFQGEREMAADNKMLGQFNLESIPPAPRGMPQIEVTFDIDANGIVSVKAKDKGTNKEQQITIQASGGLSDDEIDKMVKEAEANADADKERREMVETRNQAESLLHSTKKSLSEHADKVDPSTVEAIELAMGALEESLKTEEVGKIKGGIQNLTDAAMRLGEAIYKASADKENGNDDEGPRSVDDDIIDADFEDMGNNKRK